MVRVIIDLPADTAPSDDVVYHVKLEKCVLEGCSSMVDPKKKGNRFCSDKHRTAYHNQQRKLSGCNG